MWPFKKKSSPSGKRDNRWTGGNVYVQFPPLPPEDTGANGARFFVSRFQDRTGDETCLCIFEEPEWAQKYGAIKCIDLHLTTMVVRADSGPVAIALWHILEAGNSLCHYEHYLDLFSEKTLNSLAKIEQQSRLKLFMRNNQTGKTTGFWEFDNNFRLSEFAASAAGIFKRVDIGSFDERVAEIKRKYTTAQLIAISKS